jgi:uncharacterized protein (DUF983 family)
MLKKGTKIYSILKEKCPVCQEGEVFLTKKKYEFRTFDKMHVRCPHCNHKYEIEGGFWQGAMYVSYAFTVALSVATFVLTYLIYPETGVWYHITIISLMSLVMAPITYRMSRMIWMNLFSHYNPTKSR